MPNHSFEGRRDSSRRVPLLSFNQDGLHSNLDINNEQEDPYRQWVAATRRFESGHSSPRWIGHQETGSSSLTKLGVRDDFASSFPTLPASESTDALPATPSTAKEPRRSHFVEDLTEALSHHSDNTRMVNSIESSVRPQAPPQTSPQASPQALPQSLPTSNNSGYKGKSKYPLPSAIEEEKDSRFFTELYTISHLIFFSILGTLARLGLSALTSYPGSPLQTGTLWANFAGSLIMGFLAEDRQLFRTKGAQRVPRIKRNRDEENAESINMTSRSDSATIASKANEELAIKKTIPLYIGLATGFCGSCTSFSAFIRDAYLAISNNIPHPAGASIARNRAYSLLAVLAIILLTIILSLGGLILGTHISLGLETLLPSLHTLFARKAFNRLMVFIAFGSWLGAVILAIFPRHEFWRAQVLFSLIFAPLGCLLRFYISLYLNPKIPVFPLGTFFVNMLGTGLFALFYDLQHIPSLVNTHNGIGCELLQGGMDGFCGALTTISTWVAEIKASRRISCAYVYGGASLAVGLALAVAVVGSVQWTVGFQNPNCTR